MRPSAGRAASVAWDAGTAGRRVTTGSAFGAGPSRCTTTCKNRNPGLVVGVVLDGGSEDGRRAAVDSAGVCDDLRAGGVGGGGALEALGGFTAAEGASAASDSSTPSIVMTVGVGTPPVDCAPSVSKFAGVVGRAPTNPRGVFTSCGRSSELGTLLTRSRSTTPFAPTAMMTPSGKHRTHRTAAPLQQGISLQDDHGDVEPEETTHTE
jgi:hypothetical protein